jgi:hypothetical protein
MGPEARCRCGSNTRLVAYRRGDGEASWTCASCAGVGADIFRRLSYSRDVDFEPPSRRPAPRPEPRPPRTEMKARYTGPRARHDPLGF